MVWVILPSGISVPGNEEPALNCISIHCRLIPLARKSPPRYDQGSLPKPIPPSNALMRHNNLSRLIDKISIQAVNNPQPSLIAPFSMKSLSGSAPE